MKLVLRLALALVLAPALGLAQAPAAAADADAGHAPPPAEADGGWVIGQGMESTITDMLGGSDALPGQCTLDSANVSRTLIRVRWMCGGKDAIDGVVEHPSAARAGALVTTAKFSVRPDGKAPWPAGFAQALTARLEAKSGPFQWTEAHPNAPVPPGTFKSAPVPEGTYPDASPTTINDAPTVPGTKRRVPVTVIVLAVLAIVAIAYQVVTRRQAKAAPTTETPATTGESAPSEPVAAEPPKDGGDGPAS